PGTRAVSFGTCSLVLEPGASAYEELMRTASAQGVFTALDPNIRPGLIADADASRARPRGWLPSVSLRKLSEEDAAWLGGSPREWLAAGPAAVVVTRGAGGLVAFTRDGGEYAVPGERVRVVDTIGAGDTVNAALLHGLAARDALSDAGTAGLDADGWAGLLGLAARAAGAAPRRSANASRPAPVVAGTGRVRCGARTGGGAPVRPWRPSSSAWPRSSSRWWRTRRSWRCRPPWPSSRSWPSWRSSP